MKKFIVLIGLLINLPAWAQTNPSLSYSFSYDTASTVLTIQCQLYGTDSGKTYIELPQTFGSQKELYKAIQSISLQTPNATIDTTRDPALRIIKHAPKTLLKFTYQLKQDWTGEIVYPMNFRAILQKEYIHSTGYGLFITPKMDSSKAVSIILDWKGMPSSWTIANSLHAETRTFRGRMKLTDFQNTFYTAGDFRLKKYTISGKPLYIAMRGQGWNFSDSAFGKEVQRVITMQRHFWNDHSEPFYFVSLIPFDGIGSYNGSSLHQSFMLAVCKNFELNTPIYHLLAHEYFHRWNGVGMTLKGPEKENAWFGEGFTEYYTYKLLFKSGLIPVGDYIQATNRTIADYYLSPVRNETRATLGRNYWSSRTYNYLPYKKGFVYALYLDHLIQSHSKGKQSLDNLMHDLWAISRNSKVISEGLFISLANQYTGKKMEAVHHAMINKGQLIPVYKESLGAKAVSETKSMGAFEVGFDFEGSWVDKKVKGLIESSAAWKAGLRNGQKVKGYSIQHNDISVPVEIKIEENGVEKMISYLPMSAKKTEVPQFRLK